MRVFRVAGNLAGVALSASLTHMRAGVGAGTTTRVLMDGARGCGLGPV